MTISEQLQQLMRESEFDEKKIWLEYRDKNMGSPYSTFVCGSEYQHAKDRAVIDKLIEIILGLDKQLKERKGHGA